VIRKWAKNISKEALAEMIPGKTDSIFRRPSFMDVLAEQASVIAKRSACLFHNVGAVIFKGDQILSFGYNGPSKGDVHCYEVGCSRIINGQIKKGGGLCRGSHAELNAIGNAAKNGVKIEGASMIVSLQPCKVCAKQIVNQGIKEVYYVFEYNQEEGVKEYFKKLNIKLTHYKLNDSKNGKK